MQSDVRQGVTYGASAFPLPIALRSPDAFWGGAQFESRRFRFAQLFHNHREGDSPLKGVGLITLESATGATPSVAVTVQHLRATPHIDAGPITATRIAGFSAQQFDVTIVGSDNPPACRNIRCPKGVSLVPFTANHHCGYCTHTMHGETLDAKFAAQGQLFRIIVISVRGKTVVIYLEPLYNPNKGRFTYAKTFPTFLPYASRRTGGARTDRLYLIRSWGRISHSGAALEGWPVRGDYGGNQRLSQGRRRGCRASPRRIAAPDTALFDVWRRALGFAKFAGVVDEGIRCTECKREVDELTAIAESWPFWSDGRALLPYCPTSSEREFAPDAPASGLVPVFTVVEAGRIDD